MPRANKYEYLYVLQGDYGHGWEDLAAEDKADPVERIEGGKRTKYVTPWDRIRQTRREYIENEGGTYRIIERRVLRDVSAAA